MQFVIMLIVAIGVLNMALMSVFERMFELGVLRAVGTRPFLVAKLLIYEAASLSIISIVIGAIIGSAANFILSRVGLDFTGIEFSGITLTERIYPAMSVSQFIIYPVGVFIFTILVGIYPARYAAKTNLANAMRKKL